jgi:hypothetical protein
VKVYGGVGLNILAGFEIENKRNGQFVERRRYGEGGRADDTVIEELGERLPGEFKRSQSDISG